MILQYIYISLSLSLSLSPLSLSLALSLSLLSLSRSLSLPSLSLSPFSLSLSPSLSIACAGFTPSMAGSLIHPVSALLGAMGSTAWRPAPRRWGWSKHPATGCAAPPLPGLRIAGSSENWLNTAKILLIFSTSWNPSHMKKTLLEKNNPQPEYMERNNLLNYINGVVTVIAKGPFECRYVEKAPEWISNMVCRIKTSIQTNFNEVTSINPFGPCWNTGLRYFCVWTNRDGVLGKERNGYRLPGATKSASLCDFASKYGQRIATVAKQFAIAGEEENKSLIDISLVVSTWGEHQEARLPMSHHPHC